MKNKEIMEYIVRGDMPDLEQVRETCHRKIEQSENAPGTVRAGATQKTGIRRKVLAASAACVLVVSLSITAFAYGHEIIAAIQQFMFGNSRVAQVESIGDSDDAIAMEIVNRSEFAWNHDRNYTSILFSSFDEANKSAPFGIMEPSFIPENMELEKIAVPQFEDKTYGYDVRITYTVEIPNGINSLGLFQYYAGPDAYLNMVTVEGIQKVMVGDIEASAISWENWGVHLYWIQDEIVFEMFSSAYDLETMIKIAESIK